MKLPLSHRFTSDRRLGKTSDPLRLRPIAILWRFRADQIQNCRRDALDRKVAFRRGPGLLSDDRWIFAYGAGGVS